MGPDPQPETPGTSEPAPESDDAPADDGTTDTEGDEDAA
jgi:hypothetical protein